MHLASLPPQQEKREEEEEETVVHESNEWGRSPVVQYCLCYMKHTIIMPKSRIFCSIINASYFLVWLARPFYLPSRLHSV